jgi:prolyl-tRNA editing enzyme YbaK/EbsC (Cys-tRNA(Pro) deacylase)
MQDGNDNRIMNVNDLAAFMEDRGIQGKIVFLDEETPTVEAAAAAVDVRPEQIGKSLLFLTPAEPILVIACGTTPVSYKRLAQHLGINRKKLKLAKAAEVLSITGYTVGTVPPFGHRRPLTTLIESDVINQKDLYAGAGAINALVLLSTEELRLVTRAEIVNLHDN